MLSFLGVHVHPGLAFSTQVSDTLLIMIPPTLPSLSVNRCCTLHHKAKSEDNFRCYRRFHNRARGRPSARQPRKNGLCLNCAESFYDSFVWSTAPRTVVTGGLTFFICSTHTPTIILSSLRRTLFCCQIITVL